MSFIDDTTTNDDTFWQERYDKPLTHEDYRQINENMVGFFSLLQKWSNKQDETKDRFRSDNTAN